MSPQQKATPFRPIQYRNCCGSLSRSLHAYYDDYNDIFVKNPRNTHQPPRNPWTQELRAVLKALAKPYFSSTYRPFTFVPIEALALSQLVPHRHLQWIFVDALRDQ